MVLSLPAGGLVSGVLYYLLRPLRRGGVAARFVARFLILGMLYTTVALVAVAIGGPYIFAGRSKSGDWHTEPTTGRDMLEGGVALGLFGALIWPVVARAKGHDPGM